MQVANTTITTTVKVCTVLNGFYKELLEEYCYRTDVSCVIQPTVSEQRQIDINHLSIIFTAHLHCPQCRLLY